LKHKVIIIGSGPGGAIAALTLSQQNIPCLLIDKAFFPREKICGDALSGKVATILNRVSPEIMERFEKTVPKKNIWGIRMFAPNTIKLDIPFKWNYDVSKDRIPGYVASRIDFDNFLVNEVRRCPNIDFREGIEVDDIEKIKNGFRIKDKSKSLDIETRLLIIANGANSSFSRHFAGIKKVPKHFAAGVRAYFENVDYFHNDGFIELHFLKEYVPGYFWIFPLQENKANVGLGMRTDYISKGKINLKKTLIDIIENHPAVKDRFKNARITGKIEGHLLPLGSKRNKISGDHFMLVGDAGYLIDPTTGEGIGNAMYSGWIAAEQAIDCLKEKKYTASFMKAYDKRINRVLGVELNISYKIQRLIAYPWLVNFFASLIDRNNKMRILVTRMYTDIELRKQLLKPLFWIKLIMGRDF